MTSIIIPAHNEANTIGRLLNSLTCGLDRSGSEIIVVCNGCSDDTANVARRAGERVYVLESPLASKTNALNIGDAAASYFPRFYVDADVLIDGAAIAALSERLTKGDVHAVAPFAEYDLTGCSWPVAKYYEVLRCLPSSNEGLGFSGVYGLTEKGRSRFGRFPDLVADDTYVRLQFEPSERATVTDVRSKVFVPRTLSALVAIKTRAYWGNFELQRMYPFQWRARGRSNKGASLLSFTQTSLIGLVIFFYVTTLAKARARLRSRKNVKVWDRDTTSRSAGITDLASTSRGKD